MVGVNIRFRMRSLIVSLLFIVIIIYFRRGFCVGRVSGIREGGVVYFVHLHFGRVIVGSLEGV